MKHKLLVLTSTYPRFQGDHEPRFIADLCERLAYKYEILVLTQHRPGTKTREKINGVVIERFRYAPKKFAVLSESGGMSNALSQNPVMWLCVPLLLIAQIWATARCIKKFKPDMIHAHWLVPQTLSALIARFCVRSRAKMVATSHGADVFSLQGFVLNRLKKWLIKRCDRYCVVSHAMRAYVAENLQIDRQKIAVCPMGVDFEQTFILPTTASRRDNLGDNLRDNLDDNLPDNLRDNVRGNLIFFGRLVEKKGVKYLIQAIHYLHTQGHDYDLSVVGYGPEQQSLSTLAYQLGIEKRITFLGSIAQKESAKLFHRAEIAVFPFVESANGDIEGFGLVVAEAMGCGCPVIVGNVPATQDLVQHNETGMRVEAQHYRQLAEMILRLSKNPEKRAKLARNARDFVTKTYSWDISVKRYTHVYAEIMERSAL